MKSENLAKISFITLIFLIIGYSFNYSINSYVNIPFSDSWSVIGRYIELENGNIDIVDFILRKHGDHSHAVVYLLAYLDIKITEANLKLLQYASLISLVFIFLLLSWPVLKSNSIPKLIKYLLSLLIAVTIFNANASEILTMPFQVVVSSGKFLLVLSLMLAVISSGNKNSFIFVLSLVVASIAGLAHGSGFIVFLAISLITLLNRNYKFLLFSFLGLALFLISSFIFQKSNSNLELETILFVFYEQIYLVFRYAFAYLGAGLIRVPEYTVFFGILGVATSFVLSVLITYLYIKRYAFSYLVVFFFVLMLISGLTAPMASLLHLSIAHMNEGSYYPLSDSFFMATRYFYSAVMFWISIFILMIGLFYELIVNKDELKHENKNKISLTQYKEFYHFYFSVKNQYILFLLAFSLIAIVSVIFMQSYLKWGEVPYLNVKRENRASLKSNVWDFQKPELVPIGWVLEKINFLENKKLSLFSELDYLKKGNALNLKNAVEGYIYAKEEIPETLLNPEKFAHGYRIYGFFKDEELNFSYSNLSIYVTNDQNKIIGFAAPSSRVYLNAESFDNNKYLKDNLDVAKSHFSTVPNGGWQHWQLHGKSEGRQAPIKFNTKQYKTFLGFISKKYNDESLKVFFCPQNDCIE